jgi:hypothetical protein
VSQPLDAAGVKKRVLVFYFAAGLNVFMGLYVLAAGAGQAGGGTLTLIAFVFLVFAGVNFYMARVLRRRWEAHVRRGMQPPPDQSGT